VVGGRGWAPPTTVFSAVRHLPPRYRFGLSACSVAVQEISIV